MRIALHPSAEVGTRVGLILLAEHSLVALGLYGGIGGLGIEPTHDENLGPQWIRRVCHRRP